VPKAGPGEGIAMVRTCECGLATDDVALLERHRLTKGHREHVAWPVAGRQVAIAVPGCGDT